jgi:hypothetical protein
MIYYYIVKNIFSSYATCIAETLLSDNNLLFRHTTAASSTLICIWNLLFIQVLTEYSSIHYPKTTWRLNVNLQIPTLGEGSAGCILNGWTQLLPVHIKIDNSEHPFLRA